MHSAYRISSSFSVASRTRIPLSISSLSLSIHFSLPTHPETKLEFFNNFLMVTFSIFSFLIASNFAFRASSLAILFWSRDSFCCFFCAFLSSFDFFAKLENLLFSSYSLKHTWDQSWPRTCLLESWFCQILSPTLFLRFPVLGALCYECPWFPWIFRSVYS